MNATTYPVEAFPALIRTGQQATIRRARDTQEIKVQRHGILVGVVDESSPAVPVDSVRAEDYATAWYTDLDGHLTPIAATVDDWHALGMEVES